MSKKITYKIKRSMRKTIALHITSDGLEVRAPLRATQKKIDAFINSRLDWIEKNLDYMENIEQAKSEFVIDYGVEVVICGTKFTVTPARDSKYKTKVELQENKMIVPKDKTPEEIKTLVVRFYKKSARAFIPDRVEYWAAKMGVSLPTIRITSAHTRWGSCSAKGGINFSWLLMMADIDAIDYVIIHELAHLEHLDHSKQFWGLVNKYCPDYKTQKTVLKELGRKLLAEDWK